MKFSPAQWLFALKMYLAIMLAFVISSRIGLAQTYWTVVTCCVVMNPLSGAMRSKSVYRFTGTLCAGVVSLVLAGLLSQAPFLMLICVGLVGSAVFGASLLDRTPRSYGFQLMGITLMIITVPSVDHPGTLFDTTVTRLCEIGLAIICCTVVDSVIMPRSLGPSVRHRLGKWLSDMEQWMDDAFAGRQADESATRDRLNVLADVGSLSVLASQLRYDPLVTRFERRTAFAMQVRMLRMVPLLYGIASRIADAEAAVQEQLRKPLNDAVQRAHAGEVPSPALYDRITSIEVPPNEDAVWHKLVLESLAEMVATAVRLWSETRQLAQAIEGKGSLTPELVEEVKRTRNFPLRPDVYLAIRVFLGCLLCFTLLAALWGLTGWPQGTLAIFQAMVTMAFCGGLDAADQAILQTGRIVVIGLGSAAALSYVLFPLAKDLPTFAVVMALFILPVAAWTAKRPIGMLIMAIAFSSINFQRAYEPLGFGIFADSAVANLLGVFTAFSCIKLVRELGAGHALKRQLREEQRDIRRLTRTASVRDRDTYLNRSLNRVGLLAARLDSAVNRNQSQQVMRRLRAGVWVADLRHHGQAFAGELRSELEALMSTVRSELDGADFTPKLLERIDATLSQAWQTGLRSANDPFLRALIGLRFVLFEQAGAWRPTP